MAMTPQDEGSDREKTAIASETSGPTGWWSRGDLLAVLLFLLVLGRCSQELRIGCPDFFWHVKTGERTVRERRVIWRDDFSHTANGRVRVPQDWLFDACEYLLYSRFGLDGVGIGIAVLAAAGVTLMYWMLRHLLGVSLALALPLSWAFWGAWAGRVLLLRPAIFEALGLLAVLYCVAGWRRGRARTMLWLPPFFALWANVHGSFVYGVAVCVWLLACEAARTWASERRDAAARRRLRALSLYVGACVGATFLSAAHYHTYVTAAWFIRFKMEWERDIFEWQPWHINSHGVGGFIVVGLVVALCLARRPVSVFWTALLAGTFWYALYHRRFAAMFAAVAIPVLGVQLQCWVDYLQKTVRWPGPTASWRRAVQSSIFAPGFAQTPLYGVVSLIVIAAAALATWPSLPHGRTIENATEPGNYPFAIADTVLRYDIPGKMLNKYGDGGFLLFKLWPRQRVFVDGRSMLYGDRICLDSSDAMQGKDNWRELFEQYGVTFVICPDDAGIVKKLEADSKWVLGQSAEGHRLYLKKCPANEPVLRRLRADGIMPATAPAPHVGA